MVEHTMSIRFRSDGLWSLREIREFVLILKANGFELDRERACRPRNFAVMVRQPGLPKKLFR